MEPFSWTNFLFSFKGRMTVSDYWLKFALPYGLIAGALTIAEKWAPSIEIESVDLIFSIVALWPSVAVSVKRLHDRNRSGWLLAAWLVIVLIFALLLGGGLTDSLSDEAFSVSCVAVGVFSLWVIIEINFLSGTKGDNSYGPSPSRLKQLET